MPSSELMPPSRAEHELPGHHAQQVADRERDQQQRQVERRASAGAERQEVRHRVGERWSQGPRCRRPSGPISPAGARMPGCRGPLRTAPIERTHGSDGSTAPDPARRLKAAIRTRGSTKKRASHAERAAATRNFRIPRRPSIAATRAGRVEADLFGLHALPHRGPRVALLLGHDRGEVRRLQDGGVVEAECLDQDWVLDGRHHVAVGAAVVEEGDRVAAARLGELVVEELEGKLVAVGIGADAVQTDPGVATLLRVRVGDRIAGRRARWRSTPARHRPPIPCRPGRRGRDRCTRRTSRRR